VTAAVIRLLSTLGLCFALAGCEARPIPMRVVRDSSFLFPLKTPAFGNALSRSLGIEDRQRGDLIVAICPQANPYCSPPAVPAPCLPTPAEGFYLVTRYVTRVMPHPASNAGLRGYLDIPHYPLWEPNWGLVGQDLALLDVPANVCPGNYELSVRVRPALSAPGQNETLYGLGVDLEVLNVPDNDPNANGTNPLSANPLGSGNLNIDPDLVDLVPNPTVLVRLYDMTLTSLYPAAVEVGVNYPNDRVEILGAYQDKHLGIRSLVSWSDDPIAGVVTVSVVDPTRCTGDIRIAFRLLPQAAAVNVLTDFSAPPHLQELYDLNGSLISSNEYIVANPETSALFCGSTPSYP
jgi:hypothetical protein